MNEDDNKTVYVASQQFDALLARVGATAIYQATDRHGLLEWAALLKSPTHGWDTYLTLGIWEPADPNTIGVRASAAQLQAEGKFVRDFSELVSVLNDPYATLEHAISNLLNQAAEAAKYDLSTDMVRVHASRV
jgi:hypothetical protein